MATRNDRSKRLKNLAYKVSSKENTLKEGSDVRMLNLPEFVSNRVYAGDVVQSIAARLDENSRRNGQRNQSHTLENMDGLRRAAEGESRGTAASG